MVGQVHDAVDDGVSLFDVIAVDFGGEFVIEEVFEDFASDPFEYFHEVVWSLMYASFKRNLVINLESDINPNISQFIINRFFLMILDMFGTFHQQLTQQKMKEGLCITFLTKHLRGLGQL